ncbi:FecR family protein [Pedobacter sp. MC2016-14]|uniref:FecR family protein n=1 Tax=Pedobacter sp. MC2016-14 TaxID=2897327 RepID=UPI001E47C8E7|nr:FecR family protein [Pedobacter sp. MC2016-14]MCD0490387.1 FecR family protein [Pedobacter sp. MC2016-14]
MQHEYYQKYSNIEAFLSDEVFIKAIKDQKPEDISFWNAYEGSAPANIAIYLAAKKELEYIFSAKRIITSDAFKAKLLDKINKSIDQQQYKQTTTKRLYRYIGTAAAILLISMVSLWLKQAEVTINTAYGQKKTVTLPDGSSIMMNANSELTYPLLWKFMRVRKVYLKGEAYFKVVHLNKNPEDIKQNERFQVQTAHLNIEVLGTEFNVKDRRNTAKVTLTQGKVSVWSNRSAQRLTLKPNEMAQQTPTEKLRILQKNAQTESAWTNGNMKMQKTTVKQVIQEFEDTYGLKVILDDPARDSVKIDGTISFRTQEGVLFVLANILNANIKKDGKTIHLQPR